METKKVVLAEIDINVDGVLNRQKELLSQQEQLKKQQSELNKLKKDGVQLTAEQESSYIQNQATLKNLSSEYNQNTKLLQVRQQVEKDGINTIKDAKAALSAVSIEWANVTKIEGENSERSKQLGAQKLALTNRLKELEKATGDNTRNVGNYESALSVIESKIGGVGDKMGGFITSLIGSAKAGTLLKDSTSALAKGFDILAKNPILVIIGLIVGAFMAMKKVIAGNEEQTEKLNKIMTPFKFVLDSIMNVVQKLVDLFLNFAEGISNAAAALIDFIGIQSDSNETVKEAIKLEERKRELQDEERETLVKNAENDLKFSKLRREASDKNNLSAEERINKLKEADRLEKENSDRNVKNAKEKLALMEQEAARNKSSEEDLQAIAEQKAKVINLEKEYYDTTFRLQKQTQAAIKEISDDETKFQQEKVAKQKAANEKIVKLLETQVTYFKATNESKLKDAEIIDESIISAEEKRIQKIFELETKANERAFKLGLKDKQDYELKRIEIEKNAESDRVSLAAARLQQLRDNLDIEIREYNLANQSKLKGIKELNSKIVIEETTRLEDLKNFQLAQLSLSEESEQQKEIKRKEIIAASNEEISSLQLQFTEQENAKKLEAQTIQMQAEFDLKQSQYENEFAAERSNLDRVYEQEIIAAQKVGADTTAITQLYEKRQTEIKKKEIQARLDVASQLAGGLSELFGKETKLGKTAASAQVSIQAIQGAMSGWAAAQVYPPPFNAIVGAASVATTLALGAKNIRDIWAVKTGLPENGGGNQSSIPSSSVTSSGSNTTIPTNFDGGFANNNVGNGNSSNNNVGIGQPVLVVDQVTAKQMEINKTQMVATL